MGESQALEPQGSRLENAEPLGSFDSPDQEQRLKCGRDGAFTLIAIRTNAGTPGIAATVSPIACRPHT